MATIVLVLLIVSLFAVFALDIRQKNRSYITPTNKHPAPHRDE
jgi:hypothetical protein